MSKRERSLKEKLFACKLVAYYLVFLLFIISLGSVLTITSLINDYDELSQGINNVIELKIPCKYTYCYNSECERVNICEDLTCFTTLESILEEDRKEQQ